MLFVGPAALWLDHGICKPIHHPVTGMSSGVSHPRAAFVAVQQCWIRWCSGDVGQWGMSSTTLLLFASWAETCLSEAILNQPACPLVPLQGGRARAEAALHYADAPGCPQEGGMLSSFRPPSMGSLESWKQHWHAGSHRVSVRLEQKGKRLYV